MQKISDSTATATPAGEFTEGSSVGGVPSTLIKAAWLTTIQRELLAVLSAADLEPDPENDTQVLAAILGLIDALKVSPTFIGDPKAPTPAQFDNDTSLATTAFVQRALGSFSGNLAISGPAVTLAVGDVGKRINATATTVNLPQASQVPIGACFNVSFAGGEATLVAFPGDTISCGSLLSGAASAVFNHASFAIIAKITATAWVVLGSAALKYEDQFSASLAPNGRRKLPSGDIEQWGDFAAPANSTSVVTLPVAFPNAFYQVQLTVKDTIQAGTSLPFGGAVPINLSTFSLRNFYTQSGLLYSYRALGK